MPLDDDDNPALVAPLAPSSSGSGAGGSSVDAAAQGSPDEGLTAEDLLEDEGAASQDFRLFRKQPGVSAQTIRKGEKDFESHGTRAQADALEQSRAAMHEVLSYTRVHAGSQKNVLRGWYFPDWWRDYEEVVEEAGDGEVEGKEKRPYGHIRDRVVVLEGSSVASKNLGRAVTGQAKDRPARGRDWLLPEEALYLVERGSMDLWWPLKSLEELFPPGTPPETPAGKGLVGEDDEEIDEYELGIPLSLQAAYALLIGNEGDRGKISLQKFQVYSNLKRCGYNVLRAPPRSKSLFSTQPTSLWQWFTNLLTPSPKPVVYPPYGPLILPGLYRSYAPIYRRIALLPRHKPDPNPTFPPVPIEPFAVHFHVWKASQKWTKLRHPPPDFYLAVVDAQESAPPTLREVDALLLSTPYSPYIPPQNNNPQKQQQMLQQGRYLYARLKHGRRHVLVAVVDHGVINYMRFAEAAFGEDGVLWTRFDENVAAAAAGKAGGKKGGGRNNGRGGKSGGKGRGRR
ncbi:tRNA-splicing endonuclease subunit sen54-like protein [Thermochaetoides thermophila DSM 1495]|uniref:tRNA-splicing endonuclease subunit sen54-like protein n=1 Tax=Chaetomium thermophilum (strain DSM 1495 / CBS 144.50 / IMI 039719) TaxID=759272 RepID=G0RY34_CHATD|nr:tRNA-splicing endonuclease subunit sen54-like protein [Thermochaetoides thermophila DSM 1495]EGS23820.1 tRNA-splicing endonuclease subunit sen54-like protein [Thermochaetoides thermophila DSM 1495]